MKRLLTVLLTAALAMSLCACDKADNYSESNTESSGESGLSSTPNGTTSTEQSTPDVASAGANPIMLTDNADRALDWSNACGVEDGIYNIKKAYKTEIGTYSYIMYTDYATGQEVYLCSDSSCNHDTERCSSYLSNHEFIVNFDSRLFVHNGSLYYLNIDSIRDEDSARVGGSPYEDYREQRLYRMGLDGSNRELVYTFDNGLIVEPFAAGDGSALWFFVKTRTVDYDEERKAYFFGIKDPTLIKLDLSSRSIAEQIPLYKYKDLERVFVWGCSDGKVIFCGREFPEGVTRKDVNAMTDFDDPAADSIRVVELFKKCQSVYFTLDLNNKDIKEIYRHGYEDENMGFTDGKYAYLTDTEKRTSVRVDLESGEQSTFSPAEGYVAVGTIGGEYECRAVDKNDQTLYFIDKEGGEITSNALKSLYFSNDWMLIYGDKYDYRPISEDAVAFGKDSVLIRSDKGPGYLNFDYVLMSLDDYFNGRPNYEPIKMIDKGGK